ncbi:MAG: acetyl-CoA C-acyltransferase [Gammaproteobacteria bacterium]|nr:acetyl-CoA C-acyltransferase [Gammaproteobacteria bacterium]
MKTAYLYDAIRSPRGLAREQGALHQVTPFELLKQLYQALQDRSALRIVDVDDVMLGCVSQYGEQGGNIARASAVYAGWPDHVPGLTLSRFCSSSLDASCLAADRIAAGSCEVLVTGGVESMSRVPMLADKPSWMIDPEMVHKTRTVPLGNAADLIATEEGFSREVLDRYALQSQQRAKRAQTNGHFSDSMISIKRPDGVTVDQDEAIRGDTTMQQLATLEPAFAVSGARGFDAALLKLHPHLTAIEHNHTVGNAPGMVDGASLLLVGSKSLAARINARPRFEILGYRTCCGPVEKVLTGGILAAQQLLDQHKLTVQDLDLVEFNESFAGPTLKFIQDLGLDPECVNVNGGAISLGHPMGATGGVLTGMLMEELLRRDQELGLVAVCGATGSGTAMLIRRCGS